MTEPLTAREYRDLLSDALRDATEADTRRPDAHTLFMPDAHRTALYVDNTVVQGGRGVGKTFWYRSLLDGDLRGFAADEYRIARLRRLNVAPGHGMDFKSGCYPSQFVLRDLVADGTPPLEIWYAVLLTALGQPELKNLPEWKDKVAWVRANEGAAQRTIERADQEAHEENTVHLLLFDALEHLHGDREQADRLVAGILQLALQMRFGTRNIRFKVFIRPDMFDGAKHHFPDASKLSGNAARLEWSQTDLFGLLFHCLGNEEGELSARFRGLTAVWEGADGPRYVPPMALRNEELAQTELFEQIADPYMGANFRKGRPYTWLPNHLMDGREQVSPRSFLHALFTAAESTRSEYPSHDRALHHEAIRKGVQAASEIRVDEVSEDTPWVKAAIAPLSGCQVPIVEATVIRLWKEQGLPEALRDEAARYAQTDGPERVRTGPRHPDDLPRLVEELIDLGVMRRRSDLRLDLPDVYRIAFRVGRRGGVPMPAG
ncbi:MULTISPECIES: hypothetical protein [unclassified Streptomyces]|uniref:hypothetical protein n=1 Tax=unclassified Streptomyces TaxID=2593676 RepID=UPI000DABB7AA|nr:MULTISPECIES: hypothetical protein [unclassified Streptomyces]PZT72336.1 hypothetical protein DNK55_27705 [Streptomyces sp. AC1-42T]PZT81342.1 hypothetical protein DNK56_03865 [Streptomyces sp. AC1-42W]